MISVDIVTPYRKILENATATSVRLPAAKGEMEVLPGHAELLTLLSTGVLGIRRDEGEKRFAISYGFAEIRKDKILVLAETCEESSEIDLERAKQAQKQAEEHLISQITTESFRKYQLKLERAVTRQKVAKGD